MQLNRAQKAASLIKDGPALILAGPGSGKTAVITQRVKNLILLYGIDPSDILVVTFTRAAAGQMQQRFTMMMSDSPSVQFGTFHSVFLQILASSYGLSASDIIRESDRSRIIKEIMSHTSASPAGELCRALLEEISEIKERYLALPPDYRSKLLDASQFTHIYGEYEAALRREGLIDFGDMAGMTCRLFEERPDVCSAWQMRFKYILIDEFQDINEIQYKAVRQLAGTNGNIFAVGDDDQSIYGFRGASPDMLRRFAADYPQAKRLLLGVNYRSVGPIVEAGLRLISHNRCRFDKNLRSARYGGEPPRILQFENVIEENDYICREILAAVKLGYRYEEIALLYRTSATERAVTECFEKMNIPFNTDTRPGDLYEHWIARDVFAYIALARGDWSREHAVRIINRPVRYIRRELLCERDEDFAKLEMALAGLLPQQMAVRLLVRQLRLLAGMRPYAAINYIRCGMGYEGYLIKHAEKNNIESRQLLDVLDELQESALSAQSYDEWFEGIEAALKQEAGDSQGRNENRPGVTVQTMHKAKGLEYEIVFIPDANDGLTPHRKAVLASEIEEERRLFYVAVTRAKSRLYVLCTKLRYNKKSRPSRFIAEMLGRKEKRYGG